MDFFRHYLFCHFLRLLSSGGFLLHFVRVGILSVIQTASTSPFSSPMTPQSPPISPESVLILQSIAVYVQTPWSTTKSSTTQLLQSLCDIYFLLIFYFLPSHALYFWITFHLKLINSLLNSLMPFISVCFLLSIFSNSLCTQFIQM